MIKGFFFLCFFLPQFVYAQLTFEFRWGNQRIVPDQVYTYADNQSILFEELKVYLSDIYEVEDKDRTKISDVCLVSFDDSLSGIIKDTFDVKEKGKLFFTFGLDSSYHVNMNYEGALDPVHGMYWAWNTGYIQFKLVGRCSASTNKNKLLDYHLGGYLKPHQTSIKIETASHTSTIYLDLLPLFEQGIIQPNVLSSIVIPGKEANKLMKSLSRAIGYD